MKFYIRVELEECEVVETTKLLRGHGRESERGRGETLLERQTAAADRPGLQLRRGEQGYHLLLQGCIKIRTESFFLN